MGHHVFQNIARFLDENVSLPTLLTFFFRVARPFNLWPGYIKTQPCYLWILKSGITGVQSWLTLKTKYVTIKKVISQIETNLSIFKIWKKLLLWRVWWIFSANHVISEFCQFKRILLSYLCAYIKNAKHEVAGRDRLSYTTRFLAEPLF